MKRTQKMRSTNEPAQFDSPLQLLRLEGVKIIKSRETSPEPKKPSQPAAHYDPTPPKN